MRNSCFLFLCLLLASVQAFAQKAFSGSYVTIDGDTVSASFTDYRQWNHNPSQVTVLSADGKELTLTPQNARSFTVDGYDTYVSRRFSRLTNPVDELEDYKFRSSKDVEKQLQGFLLLLVHTNGIRLYKYRDKLRVNYFLEKEGDTLIELKHKVYLNDAGTLIYDTRYRQQLRAAFAHILEDNKKLSNKLAFLEYREDKLKQFIEQLTGQLNGQEAPKKKSHPSEFVIMGGTAYNTFKATASGYTATSTLADYRPSFAPVVGIGFTRNFLTIQLTYYNFRSSGNFIANNKEEEVIFQSNMLNLHLGVGRNFIQTPAFSWYAAVAPNLAYLPNSKETYSNTEDKSELSLFTYNLNLQTGLRTKSGLGFRVHYNLLPINVQRYNYLKHMHRSIQLGAEWRLKTKR